MKYDPGYTWLGAVITFDVTAWFVWLSALAITRHALDPVNAHPRGPSTTDH